MRFSNYAKAQLITLYDTDNYNYGRSVEEYKDRIKKIKRLHARLKKLGLVSGRRVAPSLTSQGIKLALENVNADLSCL